MRKALSVSFISFLIFLTLTVTSVFASNTTIAPSPNSGSYNKPFTVNMVIDGHGDKFNAAQTTVKLSSNLQIKNLTLGDCNFSFLHTPSIEDPSYAGVIISTYSTKCTVYTLTLVPKETGKASITLIEASVKRYGDAANILSSTYNGSYILTGTSNDGSAQSSQAKNSSENGLYTLYLKVYSSGMTPVPNALVALNTVSTKNQLEETTDKTGTAYFSNLHAEVYDAVVKEGLAKVGETILNINGLNHVLTLSIDLSAQKNNPLMKAGSIFTSLATNPFFLVCALIIGIIIGISIVLFVIKLVNKRKN